MGRLVEAQRGGGALTVGSGATGPASASVGEAVTLTARVTDDGVAVPGVPVTFSVAGPSPAAPVAYGGATGWVKRSAGIGRAPGGECPLK